MKTFLSVVIPVYNERDNFMGGRLDTTLNHLKIQKYPWELIFVDDGSTDGSKKLLTKLSKTDPRIKVVSKPHGGKMKAIFAGSQIANGKVILFADFDQSTPIHFLDNFLERHKEGADVVIGVRGKGDNYIKHDAFWRKIRSLVFLYLAKLIVMPEIEDFFCGFKSFKRTAAKSIFKNLKASNFSKMEGAYMGAWDVEALFLAKKMNLKISQEPVDWYKIKSIKLHVFKEPLLIIWELCRIRWIDLMGGYVKLS